MKNRISYFLAFVKGVEALNPWKCELFHENNGNRCLTPRKHLTNGEKCASLLKDCGSFASLNNRGLWTTTPTYDLETSGWRREHPRPLFLNRVECLELVIPRMTGVSRVHLCTLKHTYAYIFPGWQDFNVRGNSKVHYGAPMGPFVFLGPECLDTRIVLKGQFLWGIF